MITALTILKKQMDDARDLVERAMYDVDDEMLHWEPAPGCLGLRLVDGRWTLDHNMSSPVPPGPKTIGWLAAHLASVREIHSELCFGKGEKDWGDLVIPGDAEGLRQYLERAFREYRDAVERLDESDLEWEIVPTDDGDRKLAVWQALWFDIKHDVEHAGQIFQVKNEYATQTEYA